MKKELYKLKKELDYLRDKQGRGTELISLYVPYGKQLHEVTARLREEYDQASNIKSRITRNNVTSAIESLLSRLKLYNDIPINGVVFFSGAIDIGKDRTNIQTYVIYPPDPITFHKYHCDNRFYIDPLDDMLYDKKIFGLVVMDKREVTIGILRGKNIEIIDNFESMIMGKHNKGGQSAHRFEQLRRIATNDFYVKVGQKINDIFLPIDNLSGIIIGGPSATKEEFKKGEYLHYTLQKKIIGIFDTGYTDDCGIRELFDKSIDLLQDLEIIKEKKYMDRFIAELGSNTGLASYGKEEIMDNLNKGRIDKLLISDGQDIDHIVDIADSKGTDIIFISNEFEYGNQLLKFGGMVAILRY